MSTSGPIPGVLAIWPPTSANSRQLLPLFGSAGSRRTGQHWIDGPHWRFRATTTALDMCPASHKTTDSIEITVNGSARQVPTGLTVADLIALLGLAGRQVAVERNLDVVPRARHAEVRLEPGDRLELVTFVGGG